MKVIDILAGRINKSISDYHDDSAYKIKIKVGHSGRANKKIAPIELPIDATVI
jgi:hypothetical protein